MDWGLLQGLGQGLQTVGTSMREEDEEKRRAELADTLERDREKRAEARLNARPDPDRTSFATGEHGETWKIIRNSAGTELERVLADKSEIEKLKRDTEKETLTIESLRSQIEASKATTEGKKRDNEWAVQDRGLLSEEERRRAALVDADLSPSANTKYTTDGSIQRAVLTGSKRDEEEADNTTMADYAESYLDNNPSVAARFIDTKDLTQNEAKSAVMHVLKAFSQRGVKPAQSDFDRALEAYVNWKKGNKKDDKSGIKVSLSGK